MIIKISIGQKNILHPVFVDISLIKCGYQNKFLEQKVVLTLAFVVEILNYVSQNKTHGAIILTVLGCCV